MKIAELYVDLAVKGGDTAVKTLDKIDIGLGDIVSKGMLGKAAILGLVYGMERMGAAAGVAGQGFLNFNAETGASIELLQKWQYAAGLAGQSGELVAQSVANVSANMAKFKYGGAPAGFEVFQRASGLSMDKLRNNPNAAYEIFAALQKYSQGGKNPNDLKIFTEAIGANGMWATFARTKYDVANTPRDITSESTAAAGAQIDKILFRMGNTMTQAGRRMSTRLGGTFGASEGTVNETVKMFEGLMKLADQMGAFKVLNGSIVVLNGLLKELNSYLAFLNRREGKLVTNKDWDKVTAGNPLERLVGYFAGGQIIDDVLAGGFDYSGFIRKTMNAPQRPSIFAEDSKGAQTLVTISTVIQGDATKKTVDDMHRHIQTTIVPILQGTQKK